MEQDYPSTCHCFTCSELVRAQNYKPVDIASEVKFTAENLIIEYNGVINGLKVRLISIQLI